MVIDIVYHGVSGVKGGYAPKTAERVAYPPADLRKIRADHP
jgi:hypothetical protein